jgi:hypothetical protein
MTSKIDLRDVVAEHLATLRDGDAQRISWMDVLVFFGLPLIVAVAIALANITLSTSAIGILIGALSILAGLLINVLVLLYTVKEVGPTETENEEQRTLIREVNANLLYAITIAVIDIVALCILPLIKGLGIPAAIKGPLDDVWSGAIIFILGNFILTLLMALKRLKVLLDLRFKAKSNASAATPTVEAETGPRG